jgi:aldehyde:ferredoxin oxidoreductase
LNWGDHAVIETLIKKIAHREGFGSILAEGCFRASKITGKGSEKYAIHIKGQDLVEGIRGPKGWALGVVVSPRGGTHTKGAPVSENRKYSEGESERLFGVKTAGDARSYRNKAKIVVDTESTCTILDSLGVCFFTGVWGSPRGMSTGELAQFYSLATGIELSEKDLIRIAERIQNVEKMFNVRHAGFTRNDDYPPEKLMKEPIQSGPLKGEFLSREEWDKMLDEYYDLHRWDRGTGRPGEQTLEELNLHECIENLGKTE